MCTPMNFRPTYEELRYMRQFERLNYIELRYMRHFERPNYNRLARDGLRRPIFVEGHLSSMVRFK